MYPKSRVMLNAGRTKKIRSIFTNEEKKVNHKVNFHMIDTKNELCAKMEIRVDSLKPKKRD